MNAIRGTTQPESRIENSARTRVSWGADLVTIVLGLWLIGGVFADGFAHNNLRDTLDSFFSPWHAILYSGFTATALWISWLVAGQARAGLRGLNALPIGYEWGALGVIVFGLGGVGDLIWHNLFGIEVGTSALLSPTHLMLLAGGVMILTSPVRSAWNSSMSAKPKFLEFLPALLGSFAAFSFITFMHMYNWGLTSLPTSKTFMDRISYGSDHFIEYLHRESAGGILFSNVILLGVALLLLRRWQTPFGTFTIIYGVNTTIMSYMLGGSTSGNLAPVIAGFGAGIITDILVQVLQPNPTRVFEWRLFAALVPLVTWSLHFITVQFLSDGGIGLNREFWTGIIVMSAFSGLVLSVLAIPGKTPEPSVKLEP
jgi:hypothetical protein